MKRSEMISEVASVLILELIDNKLEVPDYKLSQDIAVSVLDRIEKRGMLPPKSYFEFNGGGCLCTMRESCSACGGFCNEWELEDERA